MASLRDFLRLFLITFFFVTVTEAQELCGYYKTPSDCDDDECEYHARWWYDEVRDEVIFRISADVGGEDRWTGIGFSEDENMPDSDIIVGWMSSTEGNIISDRWAESRTEPLVDGFQSLTGQTMELDGDRLTFGFTRARDTGDSQDLDFGDDNDQCYYFLFPTSGGDALSTSDTTIFQHDDIPEISDDVICIRSSSCFGTTTVETTPEATTSERATDAPRDRETTEADDDDDDGLTLLEKVLIGIGVAAAILLLLLLCLLFCCLCGPYAYGAEGGRRRRRYVEECDCGKVQGHYDAYPTTVAYDPYGARTIYVPRL